jgi:hypothetical protein
MTLQPQILFKFPKMASRLKLRSDETILRLASISADIAQRLDEDQKQISNMRFKRSHLLAHRQRILEGLSSDSDPPPRPISLAQPPGFGYRYSLSARLRTSKHNKPSQQDLPPPASALPKRPRIEEEPPPLLYYLPQSAIPPLGVPPFGVPPMIPPLGLVYGPSVLHLAKPTLPNHVGMASPPPLLAPSRLMTPTPPPLAPSRLMTPPPPPLLAPPQYGLHQTFATNMRYFNQVSRSHHMDFVDRGPMLHQQVNTTARFGPSWHHMDFVDRSPVLHQQVNTTARFGPASSQRQ